MSHNLILLTGLFLLLISCKNSAQEKKNLTQEIPAISKDQKTEKSSEEYKNENKEQHTDCDNYWKRKFPDDSLKARYINEIISNHSLTKNNISFLNALKKKEDELAFNNVLSPIFRLSNSEIGIFAFPKYKHIGNRIVPFSKEADLIEKHTQPENGMEHSGKIKFHPMILDSLFGQKNKPIINYYTVNKTGSAQIKNLGEYFSECLEYYEYSIDTTDISINDKLLFSSPFKIDLIFENNHKVDTLLQNDNKKECFDCPNSLKLQKSFARLKGTDNLYFVYADTFPINNKLDTPSRALILINKENEIIYLWYDEIDLFGCSCL